METDLRVSLGKLRASCLALTLVSATSFAGLSEMLTDPIDGQLDVSKMLDTAWGFMPIAIPVTEPAVGYGLGVGGVFFHEKLTKTSKGFVYLPSVSGVFGLATENGSKALAGFHSHSWLDDTWGYLGILADGDINLDVYSSENDSEAAYNINGAFTSHQVTRRLTDNMKVMLGYQYSIAEVGFEQGSGAIFEDNNAALTLGLAFNQLDNPLSPMSGYKVDLNYSDFNSRWGGDSNFFLAKLDMRYHKRWDTWRMAVRGLSQLSSTDTHFYSKPFIQLRGVPAMAYFGDQVNNVELETGYQFNLRWSAVAFAGAGEASNSRFENGSLDLDSGILNRKASVQAAGVGFRYLMAREYGMLAGVDFARNSDTGNAIYIQVGSAWH